MYTVKTQINATKRGITSGSVSFVKMKIIFRDIITS